MGYVPIIDTNVILYSHLLVSPFPLLFLNFAKSSLSPGDVLSFLGEGGGGFGFLPPGFACKWEKAKEKEKEREGRGGKDAEKSVRDKYYSLFNFLTINLAISDIKSFPEFSLGCKKCNNQHSLHNYSYSKTTTTINLIP